jgi:predicted DNA-binding transcriptional regulator YafY
MLSSDELDAVVLGAHWVATRGEPELARAAHNLIAKIEAVIPERLRLHLLEPSASVAPVPNPSQEVVSSSALRGAIRAGRKVALSYRDAQGRPSERIVWPVLLGYRDSGRILAAWCEARSAFRYFRSERMTSAQVLSERFPEWPSVLRARWRTAMDEERLQYTEAERPSISRQSV